MKAHNTHSQNKKKLLFHLCFQPASASKSKNNKVYTFLLCDKPKLGESNETDLRLQNGGNEIAFTRCVYVFLI